MKSIKGNSTSKATKILNTLESTEDKATKIIKEDLQKHPDSWIIFICLLIYVVRLDSNYDNFIFL